jgi:uncharacterized protein YndB with AHSA1/START domain/DNA-binding transcriptional ArsR family regulator
VEAVFRALADGSRRLLLDRLFERDGQTLEELCTYLPGMTRFGVMKHLRVLEEAGLVATRRAGRAKLHYLNPVPIRLVYDRWVSKYAEPWVAALADIKNALEENVSRGPKRVYEVFIRATPERIWQAITDGSVTRRYFHGTTPRSTWQPGAPVTWTSADGTHVVEGQVLEVDAPRRLVHTWSARWSEDVRADRPSRVTWEITPMGDMSKLSLVHDDFDGETATYRDVAGWAWILSSLKSLLETGEPLPTPRG